MRSMYLQTYGALHRFLDVQVITDNSVWLNLHGLFCGLLRRGESNAEFHTHTAADLEYEMGKPINLLHLEDLMENSCLE